jgi:hypothetical protein
MLEPLCQPNTAKNKIQKNDGLQKLWITKIGLVLVNRKEEAWSMSKISTEMGRNDGD